MISDDQRSLSLSVRVTNPQEPGSENWIRTHKSRGQWVKMNQNIIGIVWGKEILLSKEHQIGKKEADFIVKYFARSKSWAEHYQCLSSVPFVVTNHTASITVFTVAMGAVVSSREASGKKFPISASVCMLLLPATTYSLLLLLLFSFSRSFVLHMCVSLCTWFGRYFFPHFDDQPWSSVWNPNQSLRSISLFHLSHLPVFSLFSRLISSFVDIFFHS